MKNQLWTRIRKRLQELFTEQYGQDLVEYALVVALIAFGATAGIKSVAAGVKTSLTNISTVLSSDIV
jgi:pilus assembly protein Flp/PilA